MAITEHVELVQGRSVSGRFRESFEYTRNFLVRTDDPGESLLNIANAPGVRFGDPHPDDATVYALEFNAQPLGENPLQYTLAVKYGNPPASETAAATTGGGGGTPGTGGVTAPNFAAPPPDIWSGSSSVAARPIMWIEQANATWEPIVNSAGVPIPNMTADFAQAELVLQRSYTSMATLFTDISTYTNKVNGAEWIAADRFCWKCQGCRWSRETQNSGGIALMFYRATWTFAFDSDGWLLMPLDIGYQELDVNSGWGNELRPITNSNGEPVTEPVPLKADGTANMGGTPAIAGFPGQGDGFLPYLQADFTHFGVPS